MIVFLAFGSWIAMIVVAISLALGKRCLRYQAEFQYSFFCLFLVALVLFRWPYLVNNTEFCLDEGGILAAGMKYLTDFMPWRSVDGTTSGPLNTYIVMWPAILGLPMDYCTARVTGIILIFLTVLFSQRLLRQALDPGWSLVLLLPVATMYFFAFDANLIHFSSEHLPVALMAVLAWLGFKNPTLTRAGLIGFIAGAIPFTKLQAVPIAVAIVACIFGGWIFAGGREDFRRSISGALGCYG